MQFTTADAQRPGVRGHVRHRRAVSGIFMAATPVDIYIHDTYFIVAHIHYVLFSRAVFGIFAGIYYWFPKMFGRHDERDLGQGAFRPDVHLRQLHVLPDAHSRRGRPSAALSPTSPLYDSSSTAAAAEPVHQRSAPSCWGWRRSSSWSTSSAACSGARRRAAIPGTATRWNGPRRRRRRTATSSRSPIVYRGPYEYGTSRGGERLHAADRRQPDRSCRRRHAPIKPAAGAGICARTGTVPLSAPLGSVMNMTPDTSDHRPVPLAGSASGPS